MLERLKKIWKKRNTREIKKREVNVEELEEMAKNGATLLDVRSPQEYKEGHLTGSILLPEYELKTNAEKILPNKQETIIVYCSSGIRSKRAMQELLEMGYENVYNLKNGLENY